MPEINADQFTDQTTEMILDLPEASNPINNLTIIAPTGPTGTVTITVQTQTASSLGDYYEVPAENSIVDISDGLPHSYSFPNGTMVNKIKLTPSSAFSFSAKCSSSGG